MANVQSFQVANDTPVASHGMGSDVKVARFQVTLPVTAASDTIEFGFLPDYAVPVEAMAHCTSAINSIDIGITGDADGFFDGAALTANVPLRTALSTLIGKNTGLGHTAVVGTVGGTGGAAGTLNLVIHYVVEDAGVAYPFVAAVA